MDVRTDSRQIIDFEKELSPDEEIGGRFIVPQKRAHFILKTSVYWGPDLMIFYGTSTQTGSRIQLMQHYSQLSILLCVVPKEKENARRIGFVLERRLSPGDKSEGK